AEKEALKKYFDRKSASFTEKISDLQREAKKLLAEKEEYLSIVSGLQLEMQDIKRETDVLRARNTNLENIREQEKAKTKLLTAQINEIEERSRSDYLRAREEAEAQFKGAELKLIDQLREREQALAHQYEKKEDILEARAASLQGRLGTLEGERKAYLDQVMAGKNTIDDLARQVEDYKSKNIMLAEKEEQYLQKVRSLQSQVGGFQMKMDENSTSAQRLLSDQLGAQRERLTGQFSREKASLVEELANSRTQLKLAKDNLDRYLTMVKKYESGVSSSPGADIDMEQDIEMDMDYGPDEILAEMEVSEAAPAKPRIVMTRSSASLSGRDFSTVGEISSVLLMDTVGRVYIEFYPDSINLVNIGSSLYVVDGGEAAAELQVIDKFASLNSAVAEFALEKRIKVKEKGAVSVLN
ncbi:hypothetical protein ACFL42_03140, partial [Candidatus Omnitrophota bacterium]